MTTQNFRRQAAILLLRCKVVPLLTLLLIFLCKTGYTQCVITCPSDININVMPGYCAAIVNYDPPTVPGACEQKLQFDSTGNVQEFTVPVGVNPIKIKTWGAQGGGNDYCGEIGGLGGYAEGILAVTPGDILFVYVGGIPSPVSSSFIKPGGFNGGGSFTRISSGGGGGSDVRIGMGALSDRVIVAGGGGGGNYTCTHGGDGGGLSGNKGDDIVGLSGGGGGSQTSGGTAGYDPAQPGELGQGGGAVAATTSGAGGGYYGGGSSNVGGGGGGSGFIGGVANGVMQTGVNSGNGKIEISWTATITQTEGLPPASFFPLGTTTNTFKMDQGNNIITYCSFNVTVSDNEQPTVTCPGDVSVQTGAGNTECSQTASWIEPTATDICSGALSYFSRSHAPGSVFSAGSTPVTYVFKDAAGNESICSFTVTVQDNTPPEITCPQNITVADDVQGSGAALVSFSVTATDNCSAPTVVIKEGANTLNSPLTFTTGVHTMEATATDGANNTATCTFTITVSAIAPGNHITCPGNITVKNDQGKCGAVVNYHVATTPKCGKLIYSKVPGSFFTVGKTLVKVKDQSTGETCSFTITVTDTEKPTITPPAAVTININHSGCAATGVSLGKAVTKDNCAVKCVNNNAPSVFPSGATTVKWTVEDIHGNTATATQTVTVTSSLKLVLSAATISCNGSSTTLKATASGGTGYSYSLNGSSFKSSNTFTVKAGTYCVTVKDSRGCITSKYITINQPSLLTPGIFSKTNVSCPGGKNGSVKVKASGGKAPYKYKLNNGYYGSGSTFSSLKAGTYMLYVKDANDCTKYIAVTIKDGKGNCNFVDMEQPARRASEAKIIVKVSPEAKVFPNPSTTEFTLMVKGNNTTPVEIRVVDMLGRPIHQTRGSANQSYKFGQSLAPGVYIVEVLQGQVVKTIKIVKN